MKSVKKTMQVILMRTHDHLGVEGELVKVRSGYARNWLIPQGLATQANAAYQQLFEKSRARRASRIAEEKQSFQTLSDQLGAKAVQFKVRVSETGKLYGAITNQTIAEELSRQTSKLITKRKVLLAKPIKEPGNYEAELKLYPGVNTKLKIEVIKEDASEATGEKQRTRRRKKLDDLVLDAGAVQIREEVVEPVEAEGETSVAEAEGVTEAEAKPEPKKRASKKRKSEDVETAVSTS